jgi:hypothetical protein
MDVHVSMIARKASIFSSRTVKWSFQVNWRMSYEEKP